MWMERESSANDQINTRVICWQRITKKMKAELERTLEAKATKNV